MLNNILSQLPGLMKEQNPDLSKLLNPELAPLGVTITKPAVVKTLDSNIKAGYAQGVGLSNLLGTFSIQFQDDFGISIKGKPNINLIVKKNLTVTVTKDGATEIQGLLIDSIIDISIKSALIDLVKNELRVKAGALPEIKIPLPKLPA